MNKQLKHIGWVDVHTHLHLLKASFEEVSQNAQKAEVKRLITIGTEESDWPMVLESMDTESKDLLIYGAIGCHPHEAKHYSDQAEEKLKAQLQTKGIVALGEIGLDYYHDHSDRNTQKQVFRRQMEVASQKKLPVEIHTRSAEEDTLAILTEYKGKVTGLLHCFTGTWNMAKKALDIGYNISFSGIVTFKKADELRKVCEKVPLNRLHIETDAPYLAPTPYRGKENQPAWLVHTGKAVADIHQVSLEEVKQKTWENASLLFFQK